MSAASLSAAKKRRAAGANSDNNNTVVPPRDFTSSSRQNGLTMQQVITAFNGRITKLEENTNNNSNSNFLVTPDEIDSRFQILVNEIQELKDMVIKLQSFTMEVNKTLFDERIKVLTNENIILSHEIQDVSSSEDLDKEKQQLENTKIE